EYDAIAVYEKLLGEDYGGERLALFENPTIKAANTCYQNLFRKGWNDDCKEIRCISIENYHSLWVDDVRRILDEGSRSEEVCSLLRNKFLTWPSVELLYEKAVHPAGPWIETELYERYQRLKNHQELARTLEALKEQITQTGEKLENKLLNNG
ncbi:MAG: hypothetical protein AAB279_01605, partial [Candidatus Binatota bacterium]